MNKLITESQVPVKYEREGISLRYIATILYRRRLAILAISIPLILIGGINLFGQAGSYTASTRVVVELVRVDLPKWNPNSRNVDYDRELNTYIQGAMSMPVAMSAANALRDSVPVIQSLDETMMGLENQRDFARFLLGGLDVSVVGESAILDFRFTSSHPRIALMAAGAMRTAFLEYNIYGRKNDQAVEYYEEQMVVVRASVDSLLTIRGGILKEAGYSSLSDELRFDSGRLADLEGELLKAQVDRRSLESSYDRLVEYLEGDPRDFPMGPDENRASTLVYWMNAVANHDDTLNGLLALYNEESGQVRRQKAVIEESVRKLADEEHKYVRGLEVALLAVQAKENTLRLQVDKVREKNTSGTAVYRQISLLDTELKSLSNLLTNLQEKIGEVRLAQFADERVSNTMVVSDPEIVSLLTGGTTIVYFTALVIIALALGVIVGFVVENFDHRVYSPRDVEENLKLPVFASVSRTE